MSSWDMYSGEAVFIRWKNSKDGSTKWEKFDLEKKWFVHKFLLWQWKTFEVGSAKDKIIEAVNKAKTYLEDEDKESVCVLYYGHVYWNGRWRSSPSYVASYID